MKKFCYDKQCRRAGRKLKLDQFPRNKNTKCGAHPYCYECAARRQRESRARIKAANEARQKYELQRKPMVLSEAQDPFVKVYWAIVDGCRTREEIRKKTLLGYSAIGDALVELIYECKAVRIDKRSGNRSFVLTTCVVREAA